MNLTHRIKSYCAYLWNAKSNQRIHSPFVYHLLTDVFYCNKNTSSFNLIEQRRSELLKNNSYIHVTDLGAGAQKWGTTQRQVSTIAKNSLKRKKYAQLINKLVNHFQPKTSLEFGTSLGITTSYLAQGFPDGRVVTIEGCPNIAKIASETFANTQSKNITQYTGNFDDVLDKVFEQFPVFDLIFIDGNHAYSPTVAYFEKCLNHCNNNSIFIFDDIHWSQDMEKAWNEIITHPKVSISIDIYEMGIVFIRQENKAPEHFIIKY
ncbi:MAG: class I SAM-dependent methyltransferase [Chitinophagales bacterium]|nr:class I SAM-dependent methyltransferase [Chitinophagales bacterium]